MRQEPSGEPVTTAPRRAVARASALELLGVAPAAARILRYFLLRPDAEPYAREIQRILRLGGSSLQRELERLVELGALTRRQEGRRVRYRAIASSPVWKAMAILEGASADPVSLVRDAVADVPGVRAAFVFGSAARGTQRSDSDVDLFVVEDATVDRRKLLTQLSEVALLVGREVNAVRYTPQALGERLGKGADPAWRFLHGALTGPKRWVAGQATEIAPIAAAAGIDLDSLAGAEP